MNEFHRRKKSAAVLKHAIINQYATPFASKTGSTSKDNRVAFIDGYAGPGRYADGKEGSGAMLLRKARELTNRNLELHFVEQDPETVKRLREVTVSEGVGITNTVTDGDIREHLPKLLESVKEIPLFVYLDPCGLIIPLEDVAKIFERPSGYGYPATEVLINLSASLRRFGGMLTSTNPVERSLRRIDEVCGGDWWREVWREALPDKNLAEQAVVVGYAKKLRERAGGGMGYWIIDVRPRADLKPLYYLIFATRHIDGMVAFGESASLGLERWREYHAELTAEGTLFAGDTWEEDWKMQEFKLKAQWVDTLAERLTSELAKGQPFRIIERPDEIFGDLAGVVRGTHLRSAINKVRSARHTSTDPKGVSDLWRLRLKPV